MLNNTSLSPQMLLNVVIQSLEDLKAGSIVTLDVHEMTSITDYMVIAGGNSSRHAGAIAHHLVEKMKTQYNMNCVLSGDDDNEWVLVDLGDVVVHVMQPGARAYYNLEKLWSPQAALEPQVA